MKTVEIVIPCFNEAECIPLISRELYLIFQKIEAYQCKLLFVDDGSKDLTLASIKKVRDEYEGILAINYISFARNFGKESAIYAGLAESRGDYIILMDADLQHPPKLIPAMIKGIEEGYDCCAARRINRKGESVIRSFFSNIFYSLISKVTSMSLQRGETDYRIMTRQAVDAIVSMQERERFIKGIYSWIGFSTKWIEYENVERAAGRTKWSFGGLISYANSGFIAFATTPLRGASYLGMLIVIASFIYGLVVLYSAVVNPSERTGYSSLLLAILFLGGIIIMILGIIGEYLARIYLEVKRRPIYIVKEKHLEEPDR
ncbi:MAG: glycosyltransferase family 2 protein [Lachnospiraceae bacterium]